MSGLHIAVRAGNYDQAKAILDRLVLDAERHFVVMQKVRTSMGGFIVQFRGFCFRMQGAILPNNTY